MASEDTDRENMMALDLEAHEICSKYPDNCEVCHGANGGVRGNEQLVDGKVMCDYCHAEYRRLGGKDG